uniref:Putative isac anti-complement n=1 Tax=Ixodes ricinus TaxID=34613 RepID=A0A0K8RK25_IXORI
MDIRWTLAYFFFSVLLVLGDAQKKSEPAAPKQPSAPNVSASSKSAAAKDKNTNTTRTRKNEKPDPVPYDDPNLTNYDVP